MYIIYIICMYMYNMYIYIYTHDCLPIYILPAKPLGWKKQLCFQKTWFFANSVGGYSWVFRVYHFQSQVNITV